MINWKFVMLHHSLTIDTHTVSWDAIRRYHVQVLGWKDVGYHFGLELVGDLYTVQVGRNLETPGAHCKEQSMNRLAIGVCCVGNFDLAPPPAEQLTVLRSLTKRLMQDYNIPLERVVLHREYAPYKTCPGRLFPVEEFLETIR